MVRRAERIVTHSAWPHRAPVPSIGRNRLDGQKCTPSTPEFSSVNIWQICVATAGGLRSALRLRAVLHGATSAASSGDSETSLSSTSAGWRIRWGSPLRSCLTFPSRKSNPTRTSGPQPWAVRDAHHPNCTAHVRESQSSHELPAVAAGYMTAQPSTSDGRPPPGCGPTWSAGYKAGALNWTKRCDDAIVRVRVALEIAT